MNPGKEKKDVCSHRHAFFLDNFLRRFFQNPKKIIGEFIKEGDIVLDLGCGPGYFSVEMAKMVGESGKVYAVDLQKEMLEIARRKAVKSKIEARIVFHQCKKETIGLPRGLKADFILAFYMVHETPNHILFLREVKTLLKEQGKCLIVEPVMHVNKNKFAHMRSDIEDMGFSILDTPGKKGGRSLLISR